MLKKLTTWFRKKNIDMTQGPIGSRLVAFTVPILLGELFQHFYTLADSAIIGNFAGRSALAAVGASESIVRVLVGFFNGVSVGFTVVIARHFGAKDTEKLNRSVNNALYLALMIGILMTVGGLLLLRPVLRLMDTPEETFENAVVYLTIYFAGILGFVLYNTAAGILHAVGDVQTPLCCLFLSSALNIGLDLLLVLVFHMGIAGVALATIVSQWVATALSLWVLLRRDYGFSVNPKQYPFHSKTAWLLLRMGIPTGFQKTITSISNVLVLSRIISFGEACLAGWTIYGKLDNVLGVFAQSLGSALSTFVSQNLGAKQYRRIESGVRKTLLTGAILIGSLAAMLMLLRKPLVSLFSPDSEAVYFAELFVLSISMFKLTQMFMCVYAGVLRGTGRMLLVTVIMLAGIVGFRQLYLLFITRFFNIPWLVGLSYPAGWCLAGLALFFIYVFRVRRAWRRLEIQ